MLGVLGRNAMDAAASGAAPDPAAKRTFKVRGCGASEEAEVKWGQRVVGSGMGWARAGARIVAVKLLPDAAWPLTPLPTPGREV